VAPNGATSTIQVWIDGHLVSPSTTFNLYSTTHLTLVLLGAEYFDDVTIGAS
jgi:hypothetical protein